MCFVRVIHIGALVLLYVSSGKLARIYNGLNNYRLKTMYRLKEMHRFYTGIQTLDSVIVLGGVATQSSSKGS